ncbi:hypothetical protein [Roseomonas indoligenes]|uniref:Uncharacterized protein n=1 Tax=Roseomonas indoligenes TaxID=2820811 RepID=A0A940MXX3_9PROT|nr:hypothetical protein [Pararoseomonas indoligenes]MBP0491765.1 hypothetical protein [Pararoseomonas indoligenes]
MSHLHDTNAPRPDMDVLAARLAEQRYRALVERGVSKVQAWDEAVSLFVGHHPGWPAPMAEREAARTVGALILNRLACDRAGPKPMAHRVPLDLLIDLNTPETPESVRAAWRAKGQGGGVAALFKRAGMTAWPARPARLPLRLRCAPRDRMHPAAPAFSSPTQLGR